MWLAEVGSLRILIDPLLDDVHMGGVLEVCPLLPASWKWCGQR